MLYSFNMFILSAW